MLFKIRMPCPWIPPTSDLQQQVALTVTQQMATDYLVIKGATPLICPFHISAQKKKFMLVKTFYRALKICDEHNRYKHMRISYEVISVKTCDSCTWNVFRYEYTYIFTLNAACNMCFRRCLLKQCRIVQACTWEMTSYPVALP